MRVILQADVSCLNVTFRAYAAFVINIPFDFYASADGDIARRAAVVARCDRALDVYIAFYVDYRAINIDDFCRGDLRAFNAGYA